jgi:uncharacterized protein with PIN domain
VKAKDPRQTVCNDPKPEKKKAPYCGGKLKRVTALDAEASLAAGKGYDAYRCQECGLLYSEESPYASARR